jgi:hypothetical protein
VRLLVIDKETKRRDEKESGRTIYFCYEHGKMPRKEKDRNAEEALKRVENDGCVVRNNGSHAY